jgi:hypothetical protein
LTEVPLESPKPSDYQGPPDSRVVSASSAVASGGSAKGNSKTNYLMLLKMLYIWLKDVVLLSTLRESAVKEATNAQNL